MNEDFTVQSIEGIDGKVYNDFGSTSVLIIVDTDDINCPDVIIAVSKTI
jgi:hypothetical protein